MKRLAPPSREPDDVSIAAPGQAWADLARAVAWRALIVLGFGAVIGEMAGPAVSSTVLVVAVTVIQPVYGRRRYRRFVHLVRRDPSARMRHYVGGIAGSWIYVGAVAIIGIISGRHLSTIRFTVHAASAYESTQGTSAIGSAFVALAVSTILLWRVGPRLQVRIRRAIGPIAELLPHRAPERLVFAGVALTAGICEEILYRGFGIAYLQWLDPSMGRAALVALTAAAFGLAHLYQGPRNVLITGIVGAVLASLTLATGTLLPAIVIHVLIDLRISFLPSRITNEAITTS